MFILYISTFPFSFLQAILLNLLLRNYLHFNLYDQVQRNKKTALLHCIIEIFSKNTILSGHVTETLVVKMVNEERQKVK